MQLRERISLHFDSGFVKQGTFFVSLIRCIVPLMKTSKVSPLSVSHFLPEPQVIKQKADLFADDSGYLFVKYTGEKTYEDLDSSAITELLKIIPAFESVRDDSGKRKKGIAIRPDLNYEAILKYINRFGILGISDISFRNEAITRTSIPAITTLTFLPRTKVLDLFNSGSLDPKFRVRLLAIREGEEVPLRRIVEILEGLAKSVRLYMNLLEDKDFSNGKEWELNTKNRKRIVSAWDRFGGAFTDSEDPADPKFQGREEWTYRYGKDKEYSTLDFAEGSLSSFAQLLNQHLEPISKNAISTSGILRYTKENIGLETAISAFLLNSFKEVKVKRICLVCGIPFLPDRVKEENKYCGESCSKVIRNRNYRANQKKVSATKAGSKKPTNRKEKKNEPTQSGRTKGRNR